MGITTPARISQLNSWRRRFARLISRWSCRVPPLELISGASISRIRLRARKSVRSGRRSRRYSRDGHFRLRSRKPMGMDSHSGMPSMARTKTEMETEFQDPLYANEHNHMFPHSNLNLGEFNPLDTNVDL